MPESTIYPQDVELDTVKNGVARILCHWDVEVVIREELTLYVYKEAVIKWSLPLSFESEGETITISTREDVEVYVQTNAAEIMSFAKATKLTM